MPELPEVEVVRRGLHEHVVGRRIETAEFFGARVARRHLPGPVDLADRLRGNVVHAAERRGKYLWLVLEAPDGHPQGLVIHLGMSGQLLVEAPGAPSETHLHATLEFADDGPQLRFVDQRTFGGMTLADLVPDPHVPVVRVQGVGVPAVRVPAVHVPEPSAAPHIWGVPESITHIAPDPFEPAFDQGALVARLKSRHTGGQAIPPGSGARLRHRQHLRGRGVVARPGPRRAGGRDPVETDAGAGGRGCP